MSESERNLRRPGGRGSVERVLGGSPFGVLVRLLVLSFVVGLILNALDVNARDLALWIEARARALSDVGLDAFADAGRIILLGAAVVVPVWLLLRALRLLSR